MPALVQIQETPQWKKILGYLVPVFMVSVAYLDPENLETNLQAGTITNISYWMKKKARKANASWQTPSQDMMDPDIWKELPDELHENVLTGLPIAAILRFHMVCRDWKALLTSPSFAKQCAGAKREEQAHPWFCIITFQAKYAVYDPSPNKWRLIIAPSWKQMEALGIPVASTGGLVCNIKDNKNLFVCNPLTGSLRQLPARSANTPNWVISVGMLPSGNSGAYKLLWVNCGGEWQVYDSTDDSWSLLQRTPSDIAVPLKLKFRSQVVCIDGTTLYFVRSDPDELVSYDTSSGRWRQFSIPMPRRSSLQQLAQCGGRIMLVVLLSWNGTAFVCVWELQMTMMTWKRVDRMPKRWCWDFNEFTCLGNKGLLMLSLWSKARENLVVTYDPLSRGWLRVPDCESPCKRRDALWPMQGAAFYPCLTAA